MYIFPSRFWNAISLSVIGKDRLLLAILNSIRQTNWREALFCTMCTTLLVITPIFNHIEMYNPDLHIIMLTPVSSSIDLNWDKLRSDGNKKGIGNDREL